MASFARKMNRQHVRATLEQHADELVRRARALPKLDIPELVRGRHGPSAVLLGWTVHLSTGSCGVSRHWHLTARLTLPGKDDAVLESQAAWPRLKPLVHAIADATGRNRLPVAELSPVGFRVQRYYWHSDQTEGYCKVNDEFLTALEIAENARRRPAQRTDADESERARTLLERMLEKNLSKGGQ